MKSINKIGFYGQRYFRVWSFSIADKVRMKIVIKLVGQGKKVLDVGCYNGTVSSLLAQGNEVHGVDLSQKAVDLARQKGIKACLADAEDKLPFPNAFFDVVFAGEVIEHTFDTEWFLQEIGRVMKPSGSLVLTTPNLASLGRRIMLFIGKNPLIETSLKTEAAGHIRYFVKDTLFDLLRSHGFEIDTFTSDVVNFDNSGRHFSRRLAKLFPTLGKTLIVRASKTTGFQVEHVI